jgi:hypothetical protein
MLILTDIDALMSSPEMVDQRCRLLITRERTRTCGPPGTMSRACRHPDRQARVSKSRDEGRRPA